MCPRLTACVILICVSGGLQAAEDDELVIDKFQFTWTVAEVGKTQFLIEKDEKSTKAGLRHRGGLITGGEISISLEDAQAVGIELARTDEFLKKFKGTKDQSERITVGRMQVVFRTTDTGDFRVEITPDKWMRIFAILTPAEAKALAGPMKKAMKAGAMVDRKVKP
ncbi:MAG: hypothetical protein HY290_29780 [Planctomycetia bacterium]|nr:hypothetical protein [Planctomycetia bacterium]